jgi:hypothetical protein
VALGRRANLHEQHIKSHVYPLQRGRLQLGPLEQEAMSARHLLFSGSKSDAGASRTGKAGKDGSQEARGRRP